MNFGLVLKRDVSTSLYISFEDILNYFVQIKPPDTISPHTSEILPERHLLIEHLKKQKQTKKLHHNRGRINNFKPSLPKNWRKVQHWLLNWGNLANRKPSHKPCVSLSFEMITPGNSGLINMWLTQAQNTGEVLNSEKSTKKYKRKCGAVLYKNGHYIFSKEVTRVPNLLHREYSWKSSKRDIQFKNVQSVQLI